MFLKVYDSESYRATVGSSSALDSPRFGVQAAAELGQ